MIGISGTGRHISIHAAREGGDMAAGMGVGFGRISIHAAREGGDHQHRKKRYTFDAFQSTPPVKAATVTLHEAFLGDIFQSTPPVKAATKPPPAWWRSTVFQSTPPVKAATLCALRLQCSISDFNPRRP